MARMMRVHKDLAITNAKGQICYPVDDSTVHLHAVISGPEGSPYQGGRFLIDIKIPERYPIDPPKCEFLTKVYHPNIDDKGRICLSVLKTKPQGDWTPAHNVSTILDSLVILLGNPNPDDPLVADIASEYSSNREVFVSKAKECTKRYATDEQNGITGSASSSVEQDTTSPPEMMSSVSNTPEKAVQGHGQSSSLSQQDYQKFGEPDKKRLKLSRPSMKRGGSTGTTSTSNSSNSSSNGGRGGRTSVPDSPAGGEKSRSTTPVSASTTASQQSAMEWSAVAEEAQDKAIVQGGSQVNDLGSRRHGRPLEGDTVESACKQMEAPYEKHVAFLPSIRAPARHSGGEEEEAAEVQSSAETTVDAIVVVDEQILSLSNETKAQPVVAPLMSSSKGRSTLEDEEAQRDPGLADHDDSEGAGAMKTLDTKPVMSALGCTETKDKPKKSKAGITMSEKEGSAPVAQRDEGEQQPKSLDPQIPAEQPRLDSNLGDLGSKKKKKKKKNEKMAQDVVDDQDKMLKKEKMIVTALLQENMSESSVTLDPCEPGVVHQATTIIPTTPLGSLQTASTNHAEQPPNALTAEITVARADEGEKAHQLEKEKQGSGLDQGPCTLELLGVARNKGHNDSGCTDPPPLAPITTATSMTTALLSRSRQPSGLCTAVKSSDRSGSCRSNNHPVPVKSPSSFLAARSTEEIVQVARKRDLMKKKKRVAP